MLYLITCLTKRVEQSCHFQNVFKVSDMDVQRSYYRDVTISTLLQRSLIAITGPAFQLSITQINENIYPNTSVHRYLRAPYKPRNGEVWPKPRDETLLLPHTCCFLKTSHPFLDTIVTFPNSHHLSDPTRRHALQRLFLVYSKRGGYERNAAFSPPHTTG